MLLTRGLVLATRPPARPQAARAHLRHASSIQAESQVNSGSLFARQPLPALASASWAEALPSLARSAPGPLGSELTQTLAPNRDKHANHRRCTEYPRRWQTDLLERSVDPVAESHRRAVMTASTLRPRSLAVCQTPLQRLGRPQARHALHPALDDLVHRTHDPLDGGARTGVD